MKKCSMKVRDDKRRKDTAEKWKRNSEGCKEKKKVGRDGAKEKEVGNSVTKKVSRKQKKRAL